MKINRPMVIYYLTERATEFCDFVDDMFDIDFEKEEVEIGNFEKLEEMLKDIKEAHEELVKFNALEAKKECSNE